MSWYRENSVKVTRSPHQCAGCLITIPAGEAALYISCFNDASDGPFYGYYHNDCRAAECELNTIHVCYTPEDWFVLHEAENEDEPWLRANYPRVAERIFDGHATTTPSTEGQGE